MESKIINQHRIDVAELLILMATFAGLFLWGRSESRADCRRIEDNVMAIHQEMKDFHGRLCAIEERKKIEDRK